MIRKSCRRYDEPGQAHFLTFSCYRRLPLLSKVRSRGWLIESIDEARESEPFDLWAYVIMPEHVHILLSPRSPVYRISRILWRIKRPVAREAIAFLESNSPDWLARLTVTGSDGRRVRRFWQAGGGYDCNITEHETAWRLVDYLHLNPVRRGLVERPEDWEWSSARWYAGHRPVPLEDRCHSPPDLSHLIDRPSVDDRWPANLVNDRCLPGRFPVVDAPRHGLGGPGPGRGAFVKIVLQDDGRDRAGCPGFGTSSR